MNSNEQLLGRIFIVGCGDIGRRVARLAQQRQLPVAGLVRSEQGACELMALGVEPCLGHLDQPASLRLPDLGGGSVFYFAPPPGGGFSEMRVRNFLAALAPGNLPARLVYLSTSGVYGDSGDVAVDESRPAQPLTARARRRFDAEETLRAWGAQHGVTLVTLRIANIYGPGRLPVVHLQNGHPLLVESQSKPTSRVHSEDLARICLAAAEKGRPGAVFNVCDDEPCSATAYFTAVAELLGIPCPPQIPLEEARRLMKPLLFSYFIESRIMNNKKIMNDLGVELQFPRLRDGLPASLSAG
ncbi:Nucleoside-diphosphate-sugar epimerase [Geoalkalibacter ferrihydriticus]|uniref:Nucleoside-diphosphate-sugar epimerase n=1 Tax=Geoalkalibacter ferrihydriticus TaxID=392333 RepID=A0A1G9I5X3_9BACT|nr:SDR family oxidoreductase [Geoalkalibacter ferrihydriticus]SDL20648.1 Nucleoside-diphosphate-sugar epimerase [Geoalkalibacter ferrihydriticus]